MPSASTTVKKYGDALTTPVPQSGWQVEQDGFGLLQAQVKFKWDITKRGDFTTTFKKGDKLSTFISGVEAAYANMGLWRANMTTDKTNVLTVTADFAGIDPNINGGAKTNTQMAMTGATASEPIEHHPNFLVQNLVTNANVMKVLAGFPDASGWNPNLTPAINPDTGVGGNPNRALWTPKVVSNGAIQGQQFVGFLPNQTSQEYIDGNINIKAGIKNYYKPSNTMRCLFYVDNETTALGFASYVGWTTSGAVYQVPEAYQKLATGGYGGSLIYKDIWKNKIRRGFLITNCSVEQFGGIWKLTADLMLSGLGGWDRDIYPNLDAPE
jgi:hypothetical protein